MPMACKIRNWVLQKHNIYENGNFSCSHNVAYLQVLMKQLK